MEFFDVREWFHSKKLSFFTVFVSYCALLWPPWQPPSTDSLHWISDLFQPLSRVLFTFPSRYYCTIGQKNYYAWRVVPPQIKMSSSKIMHFFQRIKPSQDFNLLWWGFSESLKAWIRASLVRVRSPLLTESRLIFFFFGYLDVSIGQVICCPSLEP